MVSYSSTVFHRSTSYIFLILSLIIAVIVLNPILSYAGDEPFVRLLIDENSHKAVFRGEKLIIKMESEDGWRTVISGARAVAFDDKGGSLNLLGTEIRAKRFSIHGGAYLVSYRGQKRRGSLIISAEASGISVVDHILLETYLVGLVNGEISSRWPLEAVKAQVIAARTYALYKMEKKNDLFDLRGDVSDQVYAGIGAEDSRSLLAVNATRGLALFFGETLIPSFYHSHCGGHTSDAGKVWGIAHPVLQGVKCGECLDSPYSEWELSLSMAEVTGVISHLFPRTGRPTSLGVHRRTDDGRVTALFADAATGKVLLDANDFRKTVGYSRLPSTRFNMSARDGMVVFKGSGYGHGIGMCQWGARGMALGGASDKDILFKYYPGARLQRVY